MSTFKVTDAWARGPVPGGRTVTLDFEGTQDGSQDIQADGSTFALIATLMSRGCPIYYSTNLDAISTEPSFADQSYGTADMQDRDVIDTDVFWSFRENKGALTVILANRERYMIEIGDPGELAAWMLTAWTHTVLFNAQDLKSKQESSVR